VRMPPATGWYRRWWWVASRAAVCRSGISRALAGASYCAAFACQGRVPRASTHT
jgi:hypothetical protein